MNLVPFHWQQGHSLHHHCPQCLYLHHCHCFCCHCHHCHLPCHHLHCSGMTPCYDKPSLKVKVNCQGRVSIQRRADTSHAKLLSLTGGFCERYPLCRDQERGHSEE